MEKMGIIALSTALLLIVGCGNRVAVSKPAYAEKGYLDLTGWDPAEDGPVSLKGEWEFYWDELLSEEDFQKEPISVPNSYIGVPGTWNGYETEKGKLNGTGFATYRLTIKLKNAGVPLAVHLKTIHTAYRIYVNGKEIGGEGIVGKNKDSGEPMLLNNTVFIPETEKDTLHVLMQISNYHHREGGAWGDIIIGSRSDIMRMDRSRRDYDYFVLGSLVVMGLFFFALFFSRRNEKSYLYFSAFCLIIALRMTIQGGAGYLHDLFPSLSWEILNKTEYITMYAALPVFMLFVLSFFKNRPIKIIFKISAGISLLSIILTLFFKTIIHSWLIPFFQILLIIDGVFSLAIIIFNTVRKNNYARIFLFGFIILFFSVINDILYTHGIVRSFYSISYGLLFFVLSQAYMLTVRFVDVFNSVDRQKRQLIKTNIEFKEELEKRVLAEKDLKALNENLFLARSAIILGLAKIAEYRDSDTGSHLRRIQEYNVRLAVQLSNHPEYKNYIKEDYLRDLFESSILHDIGKVGVPDSILLKPGKLTPEEFEIIKTHPKIGGDTIRSIEKNIHAQTFLTLGREIAYMHHEKWDGTGYPNGSKGTEIPLSARITSLSDVYDALTTKRCYKEAMPHEKAVEIIKSERGKHFDPDVVDAFLEVRDDFSYLSRTLQDID